MSRIIRGHAIVFNEPSVNLGHFDEVFLPSAVDRTLRSGIDVRALSGHDTVRLLGRVTARTLKLSKDGRGLFFELDVPNTSDGNDVLELVRRRDLTGASFAFRVVNDGEEWDFSKSLPRRIVRDTTISEISLVGWPAYEKTSVDVGRDSAPNTVTGNRLAWYQRKNDLARIR